MYGSINCTNFKLFMNVLRYGGIYCIIMEMFGNIWICTNVLWCFRINEDVRDVHVLLGLRVWIIACGVVCEYVRETSLF